MNEESTFIISTQVLHGFTIRCVYHQHRNDQLPYIERRDNYEPIIFAAAVESHLSQRHPRAGYGRPAQAALLPSLPMLISNGIVPLALLLLGFIGYDELQRRAFRATRCESILGVFVLVLAGFITLTVIGTLFRGAGMTLIWPWNMPVAH